MVGVFKYDFVTNFLLSLTAEEFWNWLTFGEVRDRSIVSCFLTHNLVRLECCAGARMLFVSEPRPARNGIVGSPSPLPPVCTLNIALPDDLHVDSTTDILAAQQPTLASSSAHCLNGDCRRTYASHHHHHHHHIHLPYQSSPVMSSHPVGYALKTQGS